MDKSVVMAGFGGQGVKLAGELIGLAACKEGKNAVFFPSYGTEMRGGLANSMVIVSDENIDSPIVSKVDYLAILNQESLNKFRNKIKPGGKIFINSSMVGTKIDDPKITTYYINANDLAIELGSERAVNMLMLGALIADSKIVDAQIMKNVISDSFKEKPKTQEINLRAFDLGYSLIKS